jgi:hypothetical protein
MRYFGTRIKEFKTPVYFFTSDNSDKKISNHFYYLSSQDSVTPWALVSVSWFTRDAQRDEATGPTSETKTLNLSFSFFLQNCIGGRLSMKPCNCGHPITRRHVIRLWSFDRRYLWMSPLTYV